MRMQVRNQLTMLRKLVVAEASPSSDQRRKWIGIQPVTDGFVVFEFEHSRDLDTDGYFSPDDIVSRVETKLSTLENVLDELQRRGVDSDSFDVPWKFDYPL